MKGPNLDDYINKGVYGEKEIKKEEKIRFLGTFRERIIAVLTNAQVRESGVYKEIEELMKKHKDAKLLLNGEINYNDLSKYIKMANKHHIPFSIYDHQEYTTDIGLVLAFDYAIDKKDIFIKRKKDYKQKEKNNDSKWKRIMNKLFKK
jgi:uncharacterized protein YueI